MIPHSQPKAPVTGRRRRASGVSAWPRRSATVWRFDIGALAAEADGHLAAFSVPERERVARAATARARATFKASRWALRKTLARYLACAPGAIVLSEGRYGKPHLSGGGLEFNVTHSGSHLLIAVSDGAVGIDLETGLAFASLEDFCRQLAPREAATILAAAGAAERTALLLRCWSRKEAVSKAIGLGLALPLRSYAVPLAPTAGLPFEIAGHGRWWLRDLPAPTGSHAALASARPLRSVTFENG